MTQVHDFALSCVSQLTWEVPRNQHSGQNGSLQKHREKQNSSVQRRAPITQERKTGGQD